MNTSWGSLILSGLVAVPMVAADAETDPLVEEMVTAVSEARVTGWVQALQDFDTRHTYTQGNTDAGDWLVDYFTDIGVMVERHAFSFSGHTEENIIARIPGTTYPDEIVIISGHFDSTSEQPTTLAPGADDDASAIAAVMEAAFISRDYPLQRTVEFICYNAEEQGRRGSIAVAQDYLAADKDIVAVLNADMIGYWPTGWGRDLDVAYEPVSEWLADAVISACDRYVGIPISKKLSGVCRDDHVSFTALGIPAVTAMDCWEAHNGGIGGESTPFYHRSTDTIETLNLPCMTQAIQVSIAALAELAGTGSVVSAGEHAGSETPPMLQLIASRPNPFSPFTDVSFQVSGGDEVTLNVFDARGRRVRSLASGTFEDGVHHLRWSGTDDGGRRLPSGVYFYELASAGRVTSQRVVLAQ